MDRKKLIGNLQSAAWVVGFTLFALTWAFNILGGVGSSQYYFSSMFDRGWICGTPTLGFIILPVLMLGLVIPLIMLSGRSDFSLLICIALAGTGLLGLLRDNRTVFNIGWLGVVALFCLPTAYNDLKRNWSNRQRVVPLVASTMAALIIGAAANLAWGADHDKLFIEKTKRPISQLTDCIRERADWIELPENRAFIVGVLADPAQRTALSTGVASCFADPDPESSRQTFKYHVRETTGAVEAELVFDFQGKTYRQPFRVEKQAAP